MATTSPTCPHGSLGDFSCDGNLRITRTVFACYAPKSMRTRPTVVVQKIRSDHAGALEHWKALMSEWRVVHNDDEGLPPPTICPPEQGFNFECHLPNGPGRGRPCFRTGT